MLSRTDDPVVQDELLRTEGPRDGTGGPRRPAARDRADPFPAEKPPREDGPARKPQDAEADAAVSREAPAGKSFLRRHPLAVGAGLVLLVIAALGVYLYWEHARHFESTDDAFIDSRQFSVAPKVSGYITQVLVTDNQHVDAGDVIARVDVRDYQIALEQAEAQVSAARAAIANVAAQIAGQQAQVTEAQAQVTQTQAALHFAEQEASRYQELAQRGSGTVQQAQSSTSNLQQAQANLARAQAAVTAAERQISSLNAQRSSAEASLSQASAQRDQAQLNLSYTTVAAAQAGRVVRLTAAVGQYVQPAAAIAMFVPDEVWVTANFKETQLADMRPGQPTRIAIDAYPSHKIDGKVASIQPGSGTAFSLLPAENATGNYVKVVQRVPVKIVLDNPPTDVSLGPGMSVVPRVRVRPEPSLYERFRGSV